MSTQPAMAGHLSWSAIRTFRTCPLQYHFKYRAGLPEESFSPNLVFGAAIHRALEAHFRGLLQFGRPPGLDDLLDAYWDEWHERDASGLDLDPGEQAALGTPHDLAVRLLDLFRRSAFARPVGRILAVEEAFRARIVDGVPEFMGVVDLIVETPQELILYDWKTVRARWSEQQVELALEQLLMYAALTSHLAPGKPLRLEAVLLIKTKTPAIDHHSWPIDPPRMQRTKQMMIEVWQAIQAGHYYPAPSPLACSSCTYRKACQAWPG